LKALKKNLLAAVMLHVDALKLAVQRKLRTLQGKRKTAAVI
jgi:hypothetical protein